MMKYILLLLSSVPLVLMADETFSDASPEAKKEMKKVYEECQKDPTLSAHFDCQCWSNRFLEERLAVGPKVSAYNIKSGISNQCFNISGAAEYALNKCEGYGKQSYDLGYNAEEGMSFEAYCQCVSNNYAIQLDLLEERFTRQTANKFMTSSYLRCQTPRPGDKNIWKRLDQ